MLTNLINLINSCLCFSSQTSSWSNNVQLRRKEITPTKFLKYDQGIEVLIDKHKRLNFTKIRSY